MISKHSIAVNLETIFENGVKARFGFPVNSGKIYRYWRMQVIFLEQRNPVHMRANIEHLIWDFAR